MQFEEPSHAVHPSLDFNHWLDSLSKSVYAAENCTGIGKADYFAAMGVCRADRMLLITYHPEWESDSVARERIGELHDVMLQAAQALVKIKEHGKLEEGELKHIDLMLENTNQRCLLFKKMLDLGPNPLEEEKQDVRKMHREYAKLDERRRELREKYPMREISPQLSR